MQKAKWIWLHGNETADEYAEFFDVFSYEGGVAEIELSCDSNYALYINGILAGFGQYADFPYYKVSDTIDIATYLQKGNNELKIIVWYYVADFMTYYKGSAGLIYEVGDSMKYETEAKSFKADGAPVIIEPYGDRHKIAQWGSGHFASARCPRRPRGERHSHKGAFKVCRQTCFCMSGRAEPVRFPGCDLLLAPRFVHSCTMGI
jgi:hypothetical protein